MKTIQRQLDNIKGFDLTQNEQTYFKGGVEVPCNIMCQVYDGDGDLGVPDCCPFESVTQCEYEFNIYYFNNGIPVTARCWETGGEQ